MSNANDDCFDRNNLLKQILTLLPTALVKMQIQPLIYFNNNPIFVLLFELNL